MLSHSFEIKWISSINWSFQSVGEETKTNRFRRKACGWKWRFSNVGGRRWKSGIVNYNYALSNKKHHRHIIRMLWREKTENTLRGYHASHFTCLRRTSSGSEEIETDNDQLNCLFASLYQVFYQFNDVKKWINHVNVNVSSFNYSASRKYTHWLVID